ncbi:MAG: TAXI family TRAP transporter solute-binding subunit [Chloroflexota bacterium]
MRTKLTLVMAVFLLVSLLAACGGGTGSPAVTPAPNWPKAMSIGTGNPGGEQCPIGVGMADLITRYTGVPTTAECGGGSGANLNLLAKKEVELAIIANPVTFPAYRGIDDYQKTGPVPLRTISTGHEGVYQMAVRADSKIFTPADFKGKRFMWDWKGSPHSQAVAVAILEAYGLTTKDVITQPLVACTESAQALKEGTTDIMIFPGGFNSSCWQELSLSIPIRFIGLSGEAMNYIHKKLPYFATKVMPANTYRDQTQPLNCPTNFVSFYSLDALPEDLAYAVTKAIYDHWDQFAMYHETCKQWTLQRAVENPAVPYHAGSVRYYKEKGVWTAEVQKTQDEQLAEMKQAK